ncbi:MULTISPECIES: metal ABC transporter solute-binding protein, Zn/Mn family [unclassified Fibrobacter]|uniref:metal ABC transporter solute-binding protein, Zn/Mn family n=1 Tax=unclassified Fibrobacter TaxID=2634177 RepID=UPI000D6B0DAB|nr:MULTISPECIES: zinc ABC transporter substrate-binding protein [unclassified Fibrobacter]PWJ69045.1 zinc transport system substrate-binding protein [Fibrobacter sp. UWR4]PZW72876.1 zinc transport system substrate-binding protein [Fibrobacter sp. UWR1]
MRLVFIVLAFCASLFAANLTVAVSLQPYSSVVKEIGGDQVDVVAMLPPGADPHTFEPKPASLKEFAKASVYFSDGSGMDAAWLPRFKGVNKNVNVISLSKGIAWIEEDEHHHEGGEEHHHHGDDDDLDPHLWTSPMQMMQVAENVCEALMSLDADHKVLYRKRANDLIFRLKKLDVELRQTINKLPANSRTFIVFHPAYGYFARDYGMKQLTVEVAGKEPKPRDLANLIKTGKANNVHIVFVQPQFSKRAAATLAKELDARILDTDPLSYDYEGNIRALLKSIGQ